MTHTPKVVLLALLGTLLASGGTTAAAVPGPDPTVERAPAAGTAKAERKVIALTNKKRRHVGCDPLHLRKSIRKAARRHTHRMVEAGELSHQLSGEPDVGQRLTNAGYRNWTAWAENIALGQPTARAVVRAWMHSEGHRANILNCELEQIGVGLVRSDGVAWWTQDFGRK